MRNLNYKSNTFKRKFKNVKYSIRVLLGSVIMLHGLSRIFFIRDYVDFVLINFGGYANKEALILVASFIPFLEFLLGSLLVFKISVKRSAIITLLISFFMITCILVGELSAFRLIYHVILIGTICYFLSLKDEFPSVADLINRPKSKVDSLR